VCTVVSGIVGYASIAFLLEYLKKHTTYLFIIYRIVLGIFLLVLLQTHQLNAFDADDDHGDKPVQTAPVKEIID
jgi:undecaprenyl-diphosphatase